MTPTLTHNGACWTLTMENGSTCHFSDERHARGAFARVTRGEASRDRRHLRLGISAHKAAHYGRAAK